MSDDKIDEAIVLGRKIGTSSGWDPADDLSFVLYDFKPYDGVALPTGDITVNYDKGVFEVYDEAGEVELTFDMIDLLAAVPKVLA